jgi:hypothetical protein
MIIKRTVTVSLTDVYVFYIRQRLARMANLTSLSENNGELVYDLQFLIV